MFSTAPSFLPFGVRSLSICAAAGALAGCLPAGSASTEPNPATTPPPAAAPLVFTPKLGVLTSMGVVATTVLPASSSTDADKSGVSFNVGGKATPVEISTKADPTALASSARQLVSMTAAGFSGARDMSGLIEGHESGAHRGRAKAGENYAYLTNTPRRALEDSLGATTLTYSYIGLGGVGAVAGGTPAQELALFGGAATKTGDMPTLGRAEYKGAFEGVEQDWRGGTAKVVSSRLAGAVNMTADFGDRSFSGRVDYINRYTPSAGGPDTRSMTDYSIGFKGQIIGAEFDGRPEFTQWGADKPVGYTTQTGLVQGGFFGPKAAEAAGAIALSSAHDATRTVVTGSFGLKKQ